MTAEIEQAQRYLERFGYLETPLVEHFGFSLAKAFVGPLAPEDRGELDSRTQSALRAFQEWVGLPVTGKLDEPTLAFMEQPRCGFPDIGSFVLHSNKWTKTTLTYSFKEFGGVLGRALIEDGMDQSFKLWSAVTPLTFVKTTDPNADIIVRFVKSDHGDGSAFDGAGRVLAHAYFPPPNGGALAGDSHFDDDERWYHPTGSGIDLVTVAAHEIGHALGLAHSTMQGALMFPYYRGEARFLSEDDVLGIQSVYGAKVADPAPPPAPPVPTPPPAPPTPPAPTGGYYITHRSTLVFHRSTAHMSYNRYQAFTRREEAIAAGKRPCLICKP